MFTAALTCAIAACSLAGGGARATTTAAPLTPVTKKDCTAGLPQKIKVPTRGGDVALTLTLPKCADAARATVPVVLTYTPYEVLYRGADPDGAGVELEIWELTTEAFGRLVAAVPAPLTIGTITLADGRAVKGFLCESSAVADALDITSHGGWRTYRETLRAQAAH